MIRAVPFERVKTPILWCAGVSFAAYLFHSPLEHVLATLLPGLNGWIAVALTLVTIGVIGPVAEKSKQWWVRRLSAMDRSVRLRLGFADLPQPAREYRA